MSKSPHYAWKITKDFHPDPEAKKGSFNNATGLTGPSNINENLLKGGEGIERCRFRLYGDDFRTDLAENRMYEGELFVLEDEADENAAFAPLDDFGMPNAGCTTMAVWQKTPPSESMNWALVEKADDGGFWVIL